MNKIIAFHGTTEKIEKFNEDSIGKGFDANSALGVHASFSPSYASEYASLRETLNNKKGYVYILYIKYDDYDYIESNDDFYGNEFEGTKTKEHFNEKRNEYLKNGIDLVLFDIEESILTILNPKKIKIIGKLDINKALELENFINKNNINVMEEYELVKEELKKYKIKNKNKKKKNKF